MQTELHVLMTLALLVKGREVGFVVCIGSRDDLGRRETAAILWTLVAAVRIRVDTILRWIVTAVIGAVTAVNSVQEIIEAGALYEITNLNRSQRLYTISSLLAH